MTMPVMGWKPPALRWSGTGRKSSARMEAARPRQAIRPMAMCSDNTSLAGHDDRVRPRELPDGFCAHFQKHCLLLVLEFALTGCILSSGDLSAIPTVPLPWLAS